MLSASSLEALADPAVRSISRSSSDASAAPIRPLSSLRNAQPQSDWLNSSWLLPAGVGLLAVLLGLGVAVVLTNSPRKGGEPVSRHKAKSKKLLALGSATVVILVVAGAVVCYVLFWGNGSSDADMLACLPSDTLFITGVDVEQLLAVEFLRERVDRNKSNRYLRSETLYKAGLTEYDVAKCLVGSDDSYLNTAVLVMRFKKPLDQAKINSAMGASERSVDGKIYFKWLSGYVYYPKNDLLVLADTEALIKKALANDGKVALSTHLQQIATKEMGGGIWFASSSNAVSELSGRGYNVAPAAGESELAEFLKTFESAKAFGFQMTIDNSQVKMQAMVKCSSADAASKIPSLAKMALTLAQHQFDQAISKREKAGPEVEAVDASLRDFLKSVEVASNGEFLEASGALKYDNLEEMLRRVNALSSQPNRTFRYEPKSKRASSSK